MSPFTHSDVVIIGGGFAGCAAALHLAQRGHKPVLIEYKFNLGGRAASYKLKNWPDPLDNGQHVLLGCCDRTRRFLEEVHAGDAIAWHSDLPVSNGAGIVRTLRTWPLFAPFHLIPFLFRYPGLRMSDRLKIASGIIRLAAESSKGDDRRESPGYPSGGRVGDESVWGDAARRLGQTEDIRRLFWDPFLVSALNSDPAQSATRYVRHIVKDAFLRNRTGLRIGIPGIPLVTLFADRIRPEIEKAGVNFKMGKRVLRISLNHMEGHPGFVIHLHDQSALTAKKIILATGPAAAKMILEESTGIEDAAVALAPLVGGSPIISIHLLYDRVLTGLPFCLVQDKMIQWIFNKGTRDGRQHLQAIVSAADHVAEQSQMELVMAADAEVRAALGSGAEANLVQSVAFVEKNATFPPRANLARPGVKPTRHPGLFLAGDYVETGWPGTIESAVRSGNAAAEAALAPPI